MTAEELYMQNRPLVRVGLRIAGIDEPDEDWMQIGRMGLWRAAMVFDEKKGLRFSTVAVACIYRTAKKEQEKQSQQCRSLCSTVSMTYENSDGEDAQYDIPDDSWEPEEHLRLDDFWREAKRCLKPRDVDMLRMSAAGASYADIARTYGLSLQRVGQIYKRRFRPLAERCLDRRHGE